MKTILCYGDSNTWGADPVGGPRFGPGVRWPGVLRRELGEGYAVIEEGLPGRTTVWDDPIELHRNGRTYLAPCLESHEPLDLVIIMLGTNDLKARFGASASDIAQGAASLGQMARQVGRTADGGPPAVLLIAPPPIVQLTALDQMFAGGEAKSRDFRRYYQDMAGRNHCAFLDAGEIIVSSSVDGIHLEAGAHTTLGLAVAAEVRRLLG